MRFLAKVAPGILICIALGGLSLGQTSGACRESIVVTASDKTGRPVSSLQSESFRASVGASVVPVETAQMGPSTPRVVLLVDLSARVNTSAHSLQAVRALAENFVAYNQGKARVSTVFFSDHIVDTIGFDVPKTELLQKLSDLKDGKGSTAFYDSLIYSANLLSKPSPGEAVYAITDGGDHRSKAHLDEVEREFLSKGVRLFALMLSNRLFMTEEERSSSFDVVKLAEATGGRALSEDSLPTGKGGGRLNAALAEFYESMEYFYLLEFETPNFAQRSAFKLEVLDQKGNRRNDVSLDYPRSLAPCDPSQR